MHSFCQLVVAGLVVVTSAPLARCAAEEARPNVVFILSDDHRYDFLSCIESAPDFLETPNLDRLVREGTLFQNAFVTTSLCSPSRASVLTGQFMHRHKVVDNQRAVPKGTQFFPQWLQKSGYQTAMVGKWHMGHDDDRRRPGFDYWASFKGQGAYQDPEWNLNGERKTIRGYNADVTTNIAADWINKHRDKMKPFFLYVAYKAVHYPFTPAKRHATRYDNARVPRPETMANTERNYRTQPKWVRNRRYTIHGVDHMETTPFDNDPVPDFDDFYQSYCETVHGLDENVGRLMRSLADAGCDPSNTLVIYMGDNGFHLGEHGFYDKRDAFETSMRVPMIAWGYGVKTAGTRLPQMVQNIDIAPTILEATSTTIPDDATLDGRSFLPLLGKAEVQWRDHILYEYHWEWNFPACPTTLAIRTDRFKYIYYHGLDDRNSFHDLQTDPLERHNLIDVPAYQQQIEALRDQMFGEFEKRDGLNLPIRRPVGDRLDQRKLP